MSPHHSVKDIKTLRAKEKELLQNVLARTSWDLAKATRLLQIPISELGKKIKRHGLKQDLQPDRVNMETDHPKPKGG